MSLVVAVALGLAGCAQEAPPPPPPAEPPPAAQASLFDRLGGIEAIATVTDSFMARAGKDARINKKFAKSDGPRLRFHLIEQICAVTGGPCTYTGRDMATTHRGMGVTDAEFDALVEDLVATLDQLNVPATEKNELLGILGPLRSSIVETPGTATGTPLPAAFQPAPPLPPEKISAGPVRR
jgi:hemoglobin